MQYVSCVNQSLVTLQFVQLDPALQLITLLQNVSIRHKLIATYFTQGTWNWIDKTLHTTHSTNIEPKSELYTCTQHTHYTHTRTRKLHKGKTE